MQFRIGERDPVTGMYYVIWPDGSELLNGIKIFNSVHEVGDVVLATQRSDGMMILDSAKAGAVESAVDVLANPNLLNPKPSSYLNGQVFNNEDEVRLPVVSVKFAPGSQTQLEPGAGNFTVRIKIERTEQKDLRVKVELKGTAPSGDYSVVGLDNDSIAIIPAGGLFFDVVITPNQNASSGTIILKALADRAYRVGLDDLATAKILSNKPIVSLSVDRTSTYPQNTPQGTFNVSVSIDTPLTYNLIIYLRLYGTVGINGCTVNGNSLNTNDFFVFMAAGETTKSLAIKPKLTPTYNQDRSIVLQVLSSQDYEIGTQELILTVTVLRFFLYTIREKYPNPGYTTTDIYAPDWVILASGSFPDASQASLDAYDAIWEDLTTVANRQRPGYIFDSSAYQSVIYGNQVPNEVSAPRHNIYSAFVSQNTGTEFRTLFRYDTLV